MRIARRRSASLALAGALLAPAVGADVKPDAGAAARGRLVYVRYCVSCHGSEARGDGPLAQDLKPPVPDLTTLASRHSGQFPFERVERVIELGEPMRGHGTSEMPAWGEAFKRTKGIEAPTPKQAIRNLTQYLWSIQRTDGK